MLLPKKIEQLENSDFWWLPQAMKAMNDI